MRETVRGAGVCDVGCADLWRVVSVLIRLMVSIL
jgi:hypothetical protein